MNNSSKSSRFDGRAVDYDKYRPRYPAEMFEEIAQKLKREGCLRIADIGCGTGISSEHFVSEGAQVIGVDPNQEMLLIADTKFHERANWRSINGTAENLPLEDESVDLILCAQALHWCKLDIAKREFQRILKPGGAIALFWNIRKSGGTSFAEDYEAFLTEHAVDYKQVRYQNVQGTKPDTPIDHKLIEDFMAPRHLMAATYDYQQLFTYDELVGRFDSTSYAPPKNTDQHRTACDALRNVFERNQVTGHVAIDYDTRLYLASES